MTIHHLPSQPTPFIGRQNELSEINNLFATPTCRLLTVVGPGGIGKTRLALEVAARTDAFPNGSYFASLQSLSSSDFIIPTIADTLNVSLYGEQDSKDQLLNYLRDKALLLVLDNFEHLLDGTDVLAEILEHTLNMKLLVTSRERLRLRHEWVLDLRGLPFPEYDMIDSLEDYSAVQLFIQSARRTGYTPSASETSSINRICHLVEGMPLAIELAASWARALPCTEIAHEIEQSLDILATTTRNMPEKHRSMRAAFEQSWKLLSDEERVVFSKLSVFRGGFTRDAAEQVAGASLAILASLTDKSLVRIAASGRYDLHELLRQYGEAKQAREEKEQIEAAHAQYFAQFAQRQESIVRTQSDTGLAEAMEAEFDNLLASWWWSVDQGAEQEISRFIFIFFYYFTFRGGGVQNGEQLFRNSIELLRGKMLDQAASLVLARLINTYGWFCHGLGHQQKAREAVEESLVLFRQLNSPDQADIGWTLTFLARIALFQERYTEAKQHLLEAQPILEELDTVELVLCLAFHGEMALYTGEYRDAKQYFERALFRTKRFNSSLMQFPLLAVLGMTATALGDFQEARNYLLEAFTSKDAQRNGGIFINIVGVGILMSQLGQHEAALELLAVVIHHPFVDGVTKNMAQRRFPEIETALPPAVVITIVKRAKQVSKEVLRLGSILLPQAYIDRIILLLQQSDVLNREGGTSLSIRELEILHLIAEGLSTREVAQKLYLTFGTVRWYLNQIYKKLEVHSRVQAVSRARELKLLP